MYLPGESPVFIQQWREHRNNMVISDDVRCDCMVSCFQCTICKVFWDPYLWYKKILPVWHCQRANKHGHAHGMNVLWSNLMIQSPSRKLRMTELWIYHWGWGLHLWWPYGGTTLAEGVIGKLAISRYCMSLFLRHECNGGLTVGIMKPAYKSIRYE